MKRALVVPALALVAVLAVPGGPAATGRAQQAADDPTTLTITSAATPDYPGDPYGLTVCVDGYSYVMEAGDQVGNDTTPGQKVADVFFNDDGQCTGTPDETLTFTVAEGDLAGLVVGSTSLFHYVLDASCMEAGTGRLQVANGSGFTTPADYYAISEETDAAILLASDAVPGSSIVVPDVPTGPYVIRAFTPGTPDPTTTAPIAQFGAFTVDEGYQVQVFLAGSATGDNELGLFVEEQGPLVCSEAPEEEEPTSTTSTTAATTTTVPAGTATPATPVSAAATYTG